MTQNGRVAWREGMFLRPQHFQQQDRHIEAATVARVRPLRPYAWGLLELKLDADLAALGQFAVERASGVLPDGTPFAFPQDLPPPTPVEVGGDTRDTIVHLTLPAMQDGAVLFRTTGDHQVQGARFRVDDEEVADGFSEERAREPIEIARPNLRFGATRDQTQGRILLGLARVREVRNGMIAFDDRYIPPCLDVRASPRLTGFLADIIGRAEQRVEELAVRAVEAVDAGSESLASFLMLQALNRWVAQLGHLAALPHVHPERLYEAFLGMAGELATLTRADRRAPALPPYDHEALQPVFEAVVEALQAALSAVYDRSALQLPLQQAGPGAYAARIADHKQFMAGRAYLAVGARVPAEEIRSRFPAVAKIGAVQKMRQIVDSALAGVPLSAMPTPPPQLRALPGYVYFELDRSAADWSDFATAPALGLHVAGEWPELRMELWWVKGAAR
ncbi:type VI secretion system protein ImpJ [Sphingomonas zeicaulis]|uniref:type VI secretion system baseplate subunit TssK n=1 Tax=Sphingomonas zeicaulis TaxID=1632740 RepID=UPI003D202E89